MIDAGNLHGVIDVLDNLRPGHPRQVAFDHGFLIDPLAFTNRARFVAVAPFVCGFNPSVQLRTTGGGTELLA